MKITKYCPFLCFLSLMDGLLLWLMCSSSALLILLFIAL